MERTTVTSAPLSILKSTGFLPTNTVAVYGDVAVSLWTSCRSTISPRKNDSSSTCTSNTFPCFKPLQACA